MDDSTQHHSALADFAQWIVDTPTLFEGDDIIASQAPFAVDSIQLTEPYDGNPRLGFLYQHLCHSLFEQSHRHSVTATELQVRDKGQTLGEIDFIIDSTDNNRLEHWEVAIKFYLLYQDKWYGPNAIDRLDKKLNHMLLRQLQHTHNPPFVRQYPHWADLSQHLLMQGRLYINPFLDQQVPASCEGKALNRQQINGYWCYRSQAGRINERLYRLQKPRWATGRAADAVPLQAFTGRVLHCQGESGRFWFIVPDEWPGKYEKSGMRDAGCGMRDAGCGMRK